MSAELGLLGLLIQQLVAGRPLQIALQKHNRALLSHAKVTRGFKRHTAQATRLGHRRDCDLPSLFRVLRPVAAQFGTALAELQSTVSNRRRSRMKCLTFPALVSNGLQADSALVSQFRHLRHELCR
jgi:hypothetical protein